LQTIIAAVKASSMKNLTDKQKITNFSKSMYAGKKLKHDLINKSGEIIISGSRLLTKKLVYKAYQNGLFITEDMFINKKLEVHNAKCKALKAKIDKANLRIEKWTKELNALQDN
jgi:hypothetical protein